MTLCGLHGLLFGTLCAPFYAVCMNLGWNGMLDWIIAGLPFDAIHALSNFCLGILAMPLIKLFRRIEKI